MLPVWITIGNTWAIFQIFQSQIICISGDCGPPPVIKYTLPVEEMSGVPGDTVIYKCDRAYDYYESPGKSNTITCQSDNTWSTLPEFCARGCDVPEVLRSAAPMADLEKDIFLPGTIVGHECRSGYKRVPFTSTSITCLDNYTWSMPSEFCTRRDCGPPGETKNGEFKATDGTLFGSRVTYKCNEGYRLASRTNYRYCQANGRWSNIVPQCDVVICPAPVRPRNGIYSPEKDEYSYLDAVTFKCKKDFQVIGSSFASCTGDGTWTYNSPNCRAVCTFPPELPFAVVEEEPIHQEYFDTGTSVPYKCRKGFVPVTGKNNKLTCLSDLTWSQHELFCSPIQCGDPGDIEHGQMQSKSFFFGSIVNYTCDSGFTMISKRNYRECQADGNWSGKPPVCKVVCTFPPELPFAVVEEEILHQEFFDIGTSVRYKCRKGFVPITGKNNKLTCLYELGWIQHELFCSPIQCDNPGDIEHGQMQSKDFFFGSIVNYTCDSGYSMISKRNYRECQADGTWSGKPPECKELECDQIWELQEEARQCTVNPDEWIKYLNVQYLNLQIENLKLDIEIKKRQLDGPVETSSLLDKKTQ